MPQPTYASAALRERTGRRVSIIGIFVNIMLAGGKFLVGMLVSSVAMLGDAVNNLSDAGSSIISLISFRLSSKPADAKHPYGHARTEYLASVIVAFLILLLGVELVKNSVEKIIAPEQTVFSWLAVSVLAASIAAKLFLFLFNRYYGRRLQSSIMAAAAADSLSDVLATGAVLVSSALSPAIGFNLDGYMGVLVAIFILYSGVNILRDAFDALIGTAPTSELMQSVQNFILEYEGILGVHDLLVHSYGPFRTFASVHVEVDASRDILLSHDLIDNIERDIFAERGIHLVIHLDPIITDDPALESLRQTVAEILASIDPVLSMHDFRMVHGVSHSNLIFDVMLPFGYKLEEREITEILERHIQEHDASLFVVVNYDRSTGE